MEVEMAVTAVGMDTVKVPRGFLVAREPLSGCGRSITSCNNTGRSTATSATVASTMCKLLSIWMEKKASEEWKSWR